MLIYITVWRFIVQMIIMVAPRPLPPHTDGNTNGDSNGHSDDHHLNDGHVAPQVC